MVNVALLVVAGATFLNSISVILLAVYARKKEKEIRKTKCGRVQQKIFGFLIKVGINK